VSLYAFVSNSRPTLGVEIELNLVDERTMALRSGIFPILESLPEELRTAVKPELFQSYLEINTGICKDVNDVERDLTAKIKAVAQVARTHGLRLFWGGTHPFSRWSEQEVTPNERYLKLVDLLQETARQLVSFGLHVHVGLDSGDKAIMMCDRILAHLPALLALSANSPFWQGRETGLHSYRSRIMDTLPTSGLPPLMRNWSEYTWLLNHMVETGFIKTIREIWWDVRPHHNFGTIEVRICDMPPTLRHVLGLTALIQCLVHDLSEEIDRGTYQHSCHPFLIRQNKWRACRYGMDARLVDPQSFQPIAAREVVHRLCDHLKDRALELGCLPQLELARSMADEPTGSVQQIEIYRANGDLAEIIRQMLEQSELAEIEGVASSNWPIRDQTQSDLDNALSDSCV
jgi:carboxylate-amine ligase